MLFWTLLSFMCIIFFHLQSLHVRYRILSVQRSRRMRGAIPFLIARVTQTEDLFAGIGFGTSFLRTGVLDLTQLAPDPREVGTFGDYKNKRDGTTRPLIPPLHSKGGSVGRTVHSATNLSKIRRKKQVQAVLSLSVEERKIIIVTPRTSFITASRAVQYSALADYCTKQRTDPCSKRRSELHCMTERGSFCFYINSSSSNKNQKQKVHRITHFRSALCHRVVYSTNKSKSR